MSIFPLSDSPDPGRPPEPDPTFLETLRAARTIQTLLDNPFAVRQMKRSAYQPIVNRLNESNWLWRNAGIAAEWAGATLNPYDDETPVLDTEARLPKLWSAIDRARAANPKAWADVPRTRAEFDNAIRARGESELRQAEEVSSRSHGLGATVAEFTGGFLGSLESPFGWLGLAVGGGASRSLLIGVAKEAGANAAFTAVEQPFVKPNYDFFGRKYGAEDAARNVAAAGAFGAGAKLLGAGLVAGGRAVAKAAPVAIAKAGEAAAHVGERLGLRRRSAPDDAVAASAGEVQAAPPASPSPALTDAQLVAAARAAPRVLTPEERAAATVLQREAEVRADLAPTAPEAAVQAHAQHLGRTLVDMLDDRPLPGALAMPVSRVVTTTGREVNTVFQVAELRNVIASDHPAFDQTLQPRDRAGRKSSDVQVRQIASKLDPEQLGDSRLADTGAPIVDEAGQVLGGNGRIMGLRLAYAEYPETIPAYRAMIERRGLSTDGFQEPVLIRRVADELGPEDKAAFAREANTSATMRMSPAEQAASDARTLSGDAVLTYRGGDVNDAANRPFVRRFLGEAVAPSEVNELVDANGAPNKQGIERMRRALLARAFDDPALVEAIAESGDEELGAFGKVLYRIAPPIAKLRVQIERGHVDPAFDLSGDVLDMARRVRDQRAAKLPMGDILLQTDAFAAREAPPVPHETAAMLRLFFRGADLARMRSGDKIEEAVSEMVQRATLGPDAFGHVPTREELIYDARAAADPGDVRFSPSGADRGRADEAGGGRAGDGGAGAADGRSGQPAPTALPDPATLERFDDPHAAAASEQTAVVEHDVRRLAEAPKPLIDTSAAADPQAAARQREELQARMAGRQRSKSGASTKDAEFGLFGQQREFLLDESGAPVRAGDVLAQLDAEQSGIDALRNCLI